MLGGNLQVGARVRRTNDIGMDAPGAVVRLNEEEAMVFWPTDNFYEVLPVSELESYGAIPVAA